MRITLEPLIKYGLIGSPCTCKRGKNLNLFENQKISKQAGAELGQAQPQLGLRLANVEI